MILPFNGWLPQRDDTPHHPRSPRMLQAVASWCYRRRRLVVVFWIVALVGVSVIGSNVGSTYSQGFSLKDTESQRAADLLASRFPARAGDEGQIVFAPTGRVAN